MLFTADIDSSCVSAATYDSDEKVLSITYPSGKTYEYLNVSKDVFDELEKAPSAGRYVNTVIKMLYDFR